MCFGEQPKAKGLSLAFIGGDERMAYAALELAQKGFIVNTLGVAGQKDSYLGLEDYIILPILGVDDFLTPQPFDGERITIDDNWLINSVRNNGVILTGRSSERLQALCQQVGRVCLSYFDDEYQEKNAVPTAEGAIYLAMENLPITINGADSLVLGYGRCGRNLAQRLQALGAHVTVATRSDAQRADAVAAGLNAVNFDEMIPFLAAADCIYNTVPKLILEEKELCAVKKDGLIIDLSSAPGGVDFACAQELGLNALLATNLPGRYFPKSAGSLLAERLAQIILHHSLSDDQ